MSLAGTGGFVDSGFDESTVLAILAEFGDRAPRDVSQEIGSLELTWLIARFEERHGVVVDLDDTELNRIRTVGQAAAVLRGALRANDSGS